MFSKIKELLELIKILYVKISIMCKSDCTIGREENNKTPKTAPPSPTNDDNNNHTTTSII